MSVRVTIGSGTFENFETIIDTRWEIVPRQGETIALDSSSGEDKVFIVKSVRYVINRGDDSLTQTEILVVEKPALDVSAMIA